MTTNFLLWNVNRHPPAELVARLVREHDADLLMLVEHTDLRNDSNPERSLLPLLQEIAPFNFIDGPRRFGLYVRFDNSFLARLTPPVTNERQVIWRLSLPLQLDLLLVLVHGPDKWNNPEEDQGLFFQRVVQNITWAENFTGHKRTLVVGDFNANPFEESVSGVRGLHAVNAWDIVGSTSRTVQQEQYEIFYNPMWACYGSRQKREPPATYYHYDYKAHELFWHMLDQVVLRPELIGRFPQGQLRVLQSAEEISLVNDRGQPDAAKASDHLPVVFRLNLKPRTRRA